MPPQASLRITEGPNLHGENMTTPELLSTSEAADYIGARPHSLEIWRASGRYRIPFVKVGRLVRYRRTDLDAWLRSRTVNAEAA